MPSKGEEWDTLINGSWCFSHSDKKVVMRIWTDHVLFFTDKPPNPVYIKLNRVILGDWEVALLKGTRQAVCEFKWGGQSRLHWTFKQSLEGGVAMRGNSIPNRGNAECKRVEARSNLGTGKEATVAEAVWTRKVTREAIKELGGEGGAWKDHRGP